MKGTRFRPVLRESFGTIWRECKVALTPVPSPNKWVFVVGCYNSGTTLLAELLGRHPEISAIPTEGHFITDQFIKDYDIGLPRMWVDREDLFRLTEQDKGPDVIRIKKEWGMRLDLSKKVLVEKSPPNSARTRWLQANFENAHFIGIVRNGYAVAEGISRKGDPKHLDEGWPINRSARQWAKSNEILSEDAQHLNNFTWIKYEDLTESPGLTLNSIAKFLGLEPFSENSIESDFIIHERNEPVRNLNDLSIDRLTRDQIDIINDVAGSMLDHFGYSRI